MLECTKGFVKREVSEGIKVLFEEIAKRFAQEIEQADGIQVTRRLLY